MIIIGIDPGKNGGIAVVKQKGHVALFKMPEVPTDLLKFFIKFSNNGEVTAYIENIHGMPGMGGVSMFHFGEGYGMIKMALIACNIRTIFVTPQKWQKHFQLGTKKLVGKHWKNILKTKAQQLFPKSEIFLWGADAALIAEYGRYTEK
jgi:hypothetical protein